MDRPEFGPRLRSFMLDDDGTVTPLTDMIQTSACVSRARAADHTGISEVPKTMIAEQSRIRRLPASSGRTSLHLGLAGLLVALLLLAACARVRDELPRAIPPSGGPTGVATPSLPTQSPAPCTTTPPDTLTASPAAGNHVDDAAANQVQQYLNAHPDDAGGLIINVTVAGSGLYAGFVSNWCQHQEALRQLVGSDTRVDVFVVIQSYRAGQRLADQIFAANDALRRGGIQIGTAGVDPRSGLTSVTTPNDPAKARAAILRELKLPANAPIMVSYAELPITAKR